MNPKGRTDPEELHEQFARCSEHCAAVLERYGGHRQQRQGADCLIYFGYPVAYEDAARRAVHAGLAMVAAARGTDHVNIGIHTGVMVSVKGQLVGDVPDVARDCQHPAEPDRVLVTADTERLIRGWFDCQVVGPQSLTGSPHEILVYRVEGESAAQNRLEWLEQTHRLTRFVGREQELEQLAACLDAAQQGRGQVITVCGEPGIGKSRLVGELMRMRPWPGIWLESRCPPFFQNTSLYPVIRLLEQLLGFQPGDGPKERRDKLDRALERFGLAQPATAWLLTLLLGLPTDIPAPQTITEDQRGRMREAFLALLGRCAAEQPVVLVIEDLHWADPSTVAWLAASLNSLAMARCLTLLTYRPTFTPPWRPHRQLLQLTLGPLSTGEVERMVEDLAGGAGLPDEIRRRVVAQTDGIPLFVEELTRTLFEAGTQTHGGEIPATLHDSLLARLDRVGPAKETAQWAAILGREFAYPVLAAVVPYDERRLQDDLATLVEAELVNRPGDTTHSPYAFRHALIQKAAYSSLLKRTRRDYHGRVAQALEAHFPESAASQPEVLAQHYASAGLQAKAADFWLQAGERATAQGATLEARTFFNRALEGIEPADRERCWRALWGREAVLSLREERAAQKEDIEALLELAEAFDDDTRRAQAFLRQAQYALRLKDFQLMLRASKATIAAAGRAGNRALEVQALSSKVTALTYVGEWIAAHQAVEETLEKLPGVANDVVKAYGLGDVAFYYCRVGDLSRALLLMHQGAEAARRAGNRQKESRLDVNIGFVNAQLGRYAHARTALEDGLALAEAIGDRALQTSHRYNLSYVLWCGGDRDRAWAVGEQALLEFRTTGQNSLGHACCLAYLGIYLEEAGDWAAAAAYLAEACARYARIGVNSYRMEARAVETRCVLALGWREEARQLATEVWAYLREHGTAGIDFPSRVYLCVADVVAAVEMPGISAREVVETGYHELMQSAERISDADWRRSFLENVAENRAIIERWQRNTRCA